MKKSLQSGCIGIIARLGSKRLTDKHLIKINKQPIITYLIRRIKNHFIKEINQHDLRIFILTGEENINKRLGALTEECGISIYYGDNKNILRFSILIALAACTFILFFLYSQSIFKLPEQIITPSVTVEDKFNIPTEM